MHSLHGIILHAAPRLLSSCGPSLLQVRERDGPVAPGDWCRDLSPGCCSPPGPSDVVQFPYAILEVKLQVEAPGWVKVGGCCWDCPGWSSWLQDAGCFTFACCWWLCSVAVCRQASMRPAVPVYAQA